MLAKLGDYDEVGADEKERSSVQQGKPDPWRPLETQGQLTQGTDKEYCLHIILSYCTVVSCY